MPAPRLVTYCQQDMQQAHRRTEYTRFLPIPLGGRGDESGKSRQAENVSLGILCTMSLSETEVLSSFRSDAECPRNTDLRGASFVVPPEGKGFCPLEFLELCLVSKAQSIQPNQVPPTPSKADPPKATRKVRSLRGTPARPLHTQRNFTHKTFNPYLSYLAHNTAWRRGDAWNAKKN